MVARMPKGARVTATFRIRKDLLDEMSDFVRRNAGEPLFLTKADFIEGAVRAHLIQLRARRDGDLPSRNVRGPINPNRTT
jgi:hypothetical protein